MGNVAVYGPPEAAAVADEVGRRRPYRASQFEGGQATFERLLDEVRSLVITGPGGMPHARGIRTSLLQKMSNAQASAERGNPTAARNQLEAFVQEVRAQAGVHIAPADADRLMDLATRLAAQL